MAQAESEGNLWRNKETFLCHYHKKWKQCFMFPIRWYLYQSLWIINSTEICGVLMLSAYGKVHSPLQCPGHHRGSELGVTETFQFQEPTGAGFLKTSIPVCCLWQGSTAVSTNEVLHKRHITTDQNPLGMNRKGRGGSASNFLLCGRLFSRSRWLFPHPVWSHKVSL